MISRRICHPPCCLRQPSESCIHYADRSSLYPLNSILDSSHPANSSRRKRAIWIAQFFDWLRITFRFVAWVILRDFCLFRILRYSFKAHRRTLAESASVLSTLTCTFKKYFSSPTSFRGTSFFSGLLLSQSTNRNWYASIDFLPCGLHRKANDAVDCTFCRSTFVRCFYRREKNIWSKYK